VALSILRPKLSYTDTTPHLMALLVGAHDLYDVARLSNLESSKLPYFSLRLCFILYAHWQKAFILSMVDSDQFHREEDAPLCRYEPNQVPRYGLRVED
jgi:hypothetical protein